MVVGSHDVAVTRHPVDKYYRNKIIPYISDDTSGQLEFTIEKITYDDSYVDAKLKLRFVRAFDNKAYAKTFDRDSFISICGIHGDANAISKWLNRVYIYPADQVCVFIVISGTKFKVDDVRNFGLIEEVNSRSEDAKMVSHLIKKIEEQERAHQNEIDAIYAEVSEVTISRATKKLKSEAFCSVEVH